METKNDTIKGFREERTIARKLDVLCTDEQEIKKINTGRSETMEE